MNFKTAEDKKYISLALNYCYSPVRKVVKQVLVDKGFQVEEEGENLKLVFNIYRPGKDNEKTKFSFQNLLLEIAVKDRDVEFLEFDQNLLNQDYFLFKMAEAIEGKLRVLFCFLDAKNHQEMMDKLDKLAPKYSRIKILHTDKNRKEKNEPKRFNRSPKED